MVANTEIGIWERMIDFESADFSVEAARTFLKFDFAPSDIRRMNDLSERVQTGALSGEEKIELDNYVRAGHLLALIQSKSRLALKLAESDKGA